MPRLVRIYCRAREAYALRNDGVWVCSRCGAVVSGLAVW